MNDEWQEIPIEDVRPGDMAQTGKGRQFPVMSNKGPHAWCVQFGNQRFYPDERKFFADVGVTFHRWVKREPQPMSGEALAYQGTVDALVCIPKHLVGKRIRWEVVKNGGESS